MKEIEYTVKVDPCYFNAWIYDDEGQLIGDLPREDFMRRIRGRQHYIPIDREEENDGDQTGRADS